MNSLTHSPIFEVSQIAKCIASLQTPAPQPITCLAVHNNLLYATSLNQINVYDLTSHHYTHIINTFKCDDYPTSGSIKCMAFHRNKVFTAHQDSKIRVWQITPSKQHLLISTLPTFKDQLRNFMSPRNYVKVRRHKKSLWIQHWDAVSGLAVNGGLMYSVSWDRSFKIWNVMKCYKCLESVSAHNDAVNALAVSENGTVYTGSSDGKIRVWERSMKEGRHCLVMTLEKHRSTVNALALSDDGSVLFSGGRDRSILVWERDDGDDDDLGRMNMVFVEALVGHGGAILCLSNVGYDSVVSGSEDRTVRIWRRTGEKKGRYCCVAALEGHERPVKSVVAIPRCVSNKNNNNKLSFRICSGSLDGEIKMWEVYAKI